MAHFSPVLKGIYLSDDKYLCELLGYIVWVRRKKK